MVKYLNSGRVESCFVVSHFVLIQREEKSGAKKRRVSKGRDWDANSEVSSADVYFL